MVAGAREKVQRFCRYIRIDGHMVQKAAGHKTVCRTRGGPKGGHDPCPAAIFTRYNDATGVFPPNVLLCFLVETKIRHAVAAFCHGKLRVFAIFRPAKAIDNRMPAARGRLRSRH